jgi:hypothetical protein
MVPKASERHAHEMEKHEGERDVGEQLVRLLYGFASILAEHASKWSRLLLASIDDESRNNGRGEEDEEREHHGRATGAVAEIAFRAPGDHVAQIGKRLSRTVGEVREARVGWTQETPVKLATMLRRTTTPLERRARLRFQFIGRGVSRRETWAH